ncbi:unnamed protein product, partial [Adineta steineri]
MHSVLPQSVNSDIGETPPTQSTRSCVCIRSKLTWIIFTIVIIAIITIPTAIILTKKENVAETNSTTIMMTTTGKESITLMLTATIGPLTTTTTEPSSTRTTTTTTTESSTTTTTETSTTTTTEPSTTPPVLISLDSIDEVIYGIHGTKINQDSQASQPGESLNQYHPSAPPANACDGDTSTQYLHFGWCQSDQWEVYCGLDTGFYLELKRGASLVTALQICTANDR